MDGAAPSPQRTRLDLDQLAERIRAVETRGWESDHAQSARVPAAVPPIDAALEGGLPRAGLHEWLGLADPPGKDIPRSRWSPPLRVLAHLARQSLLAPADPDAPPGCVVWIGKRCWPYPVSLCAGGDHRLLAASLFVDPPDDAARLWAIDVSLRSRAVSAVVADGSRLTLACTRRLQLAAEASPALALLARPPGEASQRSAATTRWLVRRRVALSSSAPGWSAEILRCKGVRSLAAAGPRVWALEWSRAQGVVRASTDVVDRPGPAPSQPARRAIPFRLTG